MSCHVFFFYFVIDLLSFLQVFLIAH